MLNTYETIFIIKPGLEEEEIEPVIERVQKVIKKTKGEVTEVEKWGKKRLAYEVKKYTSGIYILMRFKGDHGVISELERNYKLIDNIIKFITLRIEEKEVVSEVKEKEEA